MFLLNAASKVGVFFLLVYLAKETAPEINRRGQELLRKAQGKLDLSFFMTRAFMALFITTLSPEHDGRRRRFRGPVPGAG